MKTKLEIGLAVEGKKGNGIIVSIITKSTGYVLVEWANGSQSKEMAFNLKINGEALKSNPVTDEMREEKRAIKMSVTAHAAPLTQKEKEDLEDYCEAKRRASKSW